MCGCLNKTDLRSMEYGELEKILLEEFYPKFCGKQAFEWIHKKQVESFDEMTNLSKELRAWLSESYSLSRLVVKKRQVSKLDKTEKFLFELEDANCIETVLMSYKHGKSICISTQVGCRMGCTFCASTIGGLVRNLTAGEILSQVYATEKACGEKVSNIVLMGIGEPLDNFEQVVKFLRIVSDTNGRNFSLRNISLSTCGIVPKIRELADLRLPVTLCLSLHASTDAERNQTMPVNKKWNIGAVLGACRYYFEKTGRRITFEYALIKGVNDKNDDAYKLAELVSGINCHVNLIPINNIRENSYAKSERKRIEAFARVLTDKGISATIRRELGSDISAACGQLRREMGENSSK